MVLSDRLNAAASMVTRGYRLADIGTDHGFVPIWLVKSGIIPSAIAMDINRGPLERAQEHIAQAGLDRFIQTRLSDGLAGLGEGEADSILIAGMGGALTVRILEKDPPSDLGAAELILQPQSEIDGFRRFLAREGYVILEEDICLDEGKYYFLMKVVHQSKPEASNGYVTSKDVEFAYGGLLLQQENSLLLDFLLREKALWEDTYSHLKQQTPNEKIVSRMEEISKKLELVNEGIHQIRR
jgi:tRNA (adenine22-N1)-methyltransferase